MDVVIAVPDRDPSGRPHLPARTVPVRCGPAPRVRWRPFSSLRIRSSGARAWSSATPAAHRPLAEGGLRLQEQAGQLGEVACAVGPQRGFQVGGVTPACTMWGSVCSSWPSGTKEVIEQRLDVFPARGADLPDHRRRRDPSPQCFALPRSATASMLSARRALSAGPAGQLSGRLPGCGQLGHRLFKFGG